jgi:type IV pilus assembly protein PilA
VAEGFQSGDVTGMNASAVAWAAGFTATKYVTGVAIAAGTGVITVTYNTAAATGGIPQLAGANTLRISPFVAGAALATGATGNIDWACTSVSKTTATAGGMGAAAVGTILGKYVPGSCK